MSGTTPIPVSADTLGVIYDFVYEHAGSMTCVELEYVTDLYNRAGCHAMAEALTERHAISDEEEDDLHHDLYLKLNGAEPPDPGAA